MARQERVSEMAECPSQENTTNPAHCFHPMGQPYPVQDGNQAVPGIAECCCHCGAAHVKILRERPANAEGHGDYLVFVDPKPSAPERPRLIVPNGPKVVH